jgi:hypothetical protein
MAATRTPIIMQTMEVGKTMIATPQATQTTHPSIQSMPLKPQGRTSTAQQLMQDSLRPPTSTYTQVAMSFLGMMRSSRAKTTML